MTHYAYKALPSIGDFVEGRITALNEEDAIAKLRLLGLYPIELIEEKRRLWKKIIIHAFSKGEKLIRDEITSLSKQVASLLELQMPLSEALDMVENQINIPQLQEIWPSIKKGVKDGSPLSEELSRYPEYFSPLYQNMIKIGEVNGNLKVILANLSIIREKEESLQSRIKKSLIYPVMTLTGLIISIIFFISYSFFSQYWWLILSLISVGYALLSLYIDSKAGRMIFDRCIFRIPMLGVILQKMYLAGFTYTLGMLLQSGIPVSQAMEATEEVIENEYLKTRIVHIGREIKAGNHLSNILVNDDLFPSLISEMVNVGEGKGSLPQMLLDISNYFEVEAKAKLKAMSNILEPALILSFGIIIGLIIIAILWPLLRVSI